jgi:hypothetical protein
MAATAFKIGRRIRVTQEVPRQRGAMTSVVEGAIVRFGPQKTGSWFAHGKDHKLWLDRVELQRPDGELVALNLDQHSRVEFLD